MSTMGEYRVPQPRSRGSLDHRPELSWRADKERLVNLFKDFRSSAVETEHLQMARELIDRHRGQKWYEYVPLDQILEENGVRGRTDQLMMMASVFDYLIKYAVNLIKPQRHPQWRAITTSKETFRTSVDCMKGARDILSALGYTHLTQNTMEFEKDVQDPDRNKIAYLATELLMCKLEVEKIHQNPQILSYHLSTGGRKGCGQKDKYHGDSDDEQFYDAEEKLDSQYGRGDMPYRAGGRSNTAQYGTEGQRPLHQPPLRAGSGASSSYTARVLRAGQASPGEISRREFTSVNDMHLASERPPYDGRVPHRQDRGSNYPGNGRPFSDNRKHIGETTNPPSPLPRIGGDSTKPYSFDRRPVDDMNPRTSANNDLSAPGRSGSRTAGSGPSTTYGSFSAQQSGFERTSVSTVQSSIPPVQSISSSSSSGSVERPSVSPIGSSTPLRPPADGGIPGQSGNPGGQPKNPGDRPVPIPRKRTKSNTSMVSLGSSTGRPPSAGSVSSSGSPDLLSGSGSGRLPGDMSRSFNFDISSSPKEPSSSVGLPLTSNSVADTSSTSSTSVSGGSSVSDLQKQLEILKQKRAIKMRGGHTNAMTSMSSLEDHSSMSQRRSQTVSHSMRGGVEGEVDLKSLTSGFGDPSSLTSSTSVSSSSRIKYPPGKRRPVTFKSDCIQEEDEVAYSFEGSGAGHRGMSSDMGHGNRIPSSGRRVFPGEQRAPSVDHQGISMNVHTPPSDRHAPPTERRPHSGEHRPHSGEHRPQSREHQEQRPLYGEYRPHSGEQHPHSGEHRPQSREHQEQRPLYGEYRPHSGEQHPLSGEQRPHSGEYHDPYVNRHPHSSENQPHPLPRLPVDRSAQQTPVTPTAAPRSSVRPQTTPITPKACCRQCKGHIMTVNAKFCPNCGTKDPFTPSKSVDDEILKTVHARPYEEEKLPIRASVKDTEQVEQMHWSKIQQLKEKEGEEEGSKVASQPGSQDRKVGGSGLNVRREEDPGRHGAGGRYGSEGFDYGGQEGGGVEGGLGARNEGGARSGMGRGDMEMGGPLSHVSGDRFEDGIISLGIEKNLDSIRQAEKDEKARCYREFQEKQARDKEEPDSEHVRRKGGASNVGVGDGFMSKAERGRGGGGNNLSDGNVSLAIEENLDSIRQTEKDEKARRYQEFVKKQAREEREKNERERRGQEHLRRDGGPGADVGGRDNVASKVEKGGASSGRGGGGANRVNDGNVGLVSIRQTELDEKERCRQEFEQRKEREERERMQRNNAVKEQQDVPHFPGQGRGAPPRAVGGSSPKAEGGPSPMSGGGASQKGGGGGPLRARKGSPPRISSNRMMNSLEREGRQLLECFKECTKFNYSLGEIQRAYHEAHDRNALRYLDTTWANKVRTVRQTVGNHHKNGGKKLGFPTEKETRDMLVVTGGNVEGASIKIAEEREKKIHQLVNMMDSLKRRDPTLLELDWDTAAEALSRNGMDVSATFYVLQTDWLEPLYEFIFSEFTDAKQKDMENIKNMVTSKDDHEKYSPEARNRLLMAEFRFQEQQKAKMVLELIELVEVDDQSYPLNYYIDAAKDFKTVDDALVFLSQECPICFLSYPIHEMITMPGCTDSICKTCFTQYLTMVVRNLEVKHYNCPVCGMPNMADREAANDMYLQILVAMAKELLEPEVYQMMQSKLTDFSLMTQPGFIWCTNCPNGFIFEVDGPRVARAITCSACEKKMCHKCKKPWEAQHEGASCEKFAQWKQDNDPDAQKQGLAAHLNANGIECPACHMRYDLAKGGCMHFTCTRCPNEFCSGCSLSIKKGMQCGRFESCVKMGLHAHHPRDCLFYLRDFDVKELQDFLRQNNMEFDVEPPKEQVEAGRAKKEEEGKEKGKAGAAEADVKLHCRVMLQKEKPEGLCDEECGGEVPAGHAGLCKTHYKEYLVDKINKNKLDPINMYSLQQIKRILEREEVEVPEINDEDVGDEQESEEQYTARLIEHVKRVLPLHRQQQEEADGALAAAENLMPAAARLLVEDIEEEEP